MNKIGIMTMYYESLNCGGNLQAYALARSLQVLGFDAEQICFKYKEAIISSRSFLEKAISIIKNVPNIISKKRHQKFFDETMEKRKKSFSHFNKDLIPHSKTIYSKETIATSNAVYGCFVVGSDQVWNIEMRIDEFFLPFTEKKKIAYAASVALSSLNKKQEEFFSSKLDRFSSITVREKSSIDLLKGLTKNNIELALDPTLLLSKEEWDEISEDVDYGFDFVFCYFMGTNKRSRKMASEFARSKGLKIVFCPFANGEYLKEDADFGDHLVSSFSPGVFVGLVKKAKYIITDSFHAAVFSILYGKKFIVMNRDKNGKMNSRIVSLFDLFGCSNKLCGKHNETQSYLQKNIEENVRNDSEAFLKLKSESLSFLKKAVE